MIGDALALLGANACLLVAGVGVLRLAAPRLRLADLGLAYLAGVAAVGVLCPLLLMAGLDLTLLEFLLLCAGLFLTGFLRRPRERALEPRPALSDDRRLILLAAGITVAFLVLLAVVVSFEPLYRTDAWAQWTPKARAIVLLGGLDPRVFSGEAYRGMNLDYPLLVPSLEAIDFRFMGFDTQILHLQPFFLFVAYLAALAALVRDRVPRTILWPILLAIALAPTLAIQTASLYADVPLAVFFGLAGLCGWRWLGDGDRGSLALFGLFAAAALATKIEGRIFVGVLALLFVVLAWRGSRARALATAGAAGAAVLVAVVPWRVWTHVHDVPINFPEGNAFSPSFLAAHVGRIPHTVQVLARDLLDPTAWLLLVPVALAAVLLALRLSARKDEAALVLGTFGLSFAGLVWTYWSTPFDLDWHLGTSATRVIIAPALFCASFAPILLTRVLESARTAARPLPGSELREQPGPGAERRHAPAASRAVEQLGIAEDDPAEP